MQKSKINCDLRFKSCLVELLFCYKIIGSLKCFLMLCIQQQSLKGKYLCYLLKYFRHIIMSGSIRHRSWIGNLGEQL